MKWNIPKIEDVLVLEKELIVKVHLGYWCSKDVRLIAERFHNIMWKGHHYSIYPSYYLGAPSKKFINICLMVGEKLTIVSLYATSSNIYTEIKVAFRLKYKNRWRTYRIWLPQKSIEELEYQVQPEEGFSGYHEVL